MELLVVVQVLGMVTYMGVAGLCLVLSSHLRQIDSLVRKYKSTFHAHLSNGQRPIQLILFVNLKFGEGCNTPGQAK